MLLWTDYETNQKSPNKENEKEKTIRWADTRLRQGEKTDKKSGLHKGWDDELRHRWFMTKSRNLEKDDSRT